MAEIGISDFSEGFDSTGVNSYLQAIKSDALNVASDAVKNTKVLEDKCTENWSGQACTDFIEKLKEAANHVAAQYDELYIKLCSELSQVATDMKTFDDNLIL